jgi:hypothetical protein
MPVFKPPYGPKDPKQHVTSAAKNYGFRFYVAFLVDGGASPDYIKRACIEAREAGAPKDMVHTKEYGGWFTRGEVTNPVTARRLDSYAAALTKYEADLKAERST